VLKQRHFLTGSATSVIAFGLKSGLNLVLIPIIVRAFGAEWFGFYMFMVGLVELIGSMAYGPMNALIQQLNFAVAQNTPERVPGLLRASQLILGLGGLCIVALVWAASPWILTSLKLPDTLSGVGPWVIGLSLIEAFIWFSCTYFRAIMAAHARYHWTNGTDMGLAILNSIMPIVLLWQGYGLVEVMLARVLTATAVYGLLLGSLAKQIEPEALWPGPFWPKGEFRQIARISSYGGASSIVGVLAERVDGFVIASFAGLTPLAMFSIVQRVMGQIAYLGWRLSEIGMPWMSRLCAQGAQEKSRTMVLRMACALNFLALGLITWFGIYFPGIFKALSQGRIPVENAIPLALAFGVIVWSKVDSEAAKMYLLGQQKYRYLTLSSIVASVVNFGISLVLVFPLGALGPALGTLVTLSVFHQVILIPMALRQLAIPIPEYVWTVYIKNLVPVGAAGSAIWLAQNWLVEHLYFWPSFFISGFFGGTLALCLWYWIAASPLEQALVMQGIAKFTKPQPTSAVAPVD
jgi:O-antigen/teichoic acid export membrane protein